MADPAHKLELFYGGRPMTLARDPSIAPNGTWQFTGYDAAVPLDNSSLALDDAAYGARWAAGLADGDDLWLHGFFKFDVRCPSHASFPSTQPRPHGMASPHI